MGNVWDALTRSVREARRELDRMADQSAALTERLDDLEAKIMEAQSTPGGGTCAAKASGPLYTEGE